jgi:tRNA (mo5U34)-methyltransferase
VRRSAAGRPGSRDVSPEAIRRKVDELAPWFHNLRLPGGVETAPDHPLGDFPTVKWRQLAPTLPSDLHGWTALDIGCNAGFYSLELARRGAEVLAIDHDERYLSQGRWVAHLLGQERGLRFRRRQVYELARSTEQFDLVLFMGVFYHLRYPLLGLDIAARLCRRLMVFQTLTMPGTAVRQDTYDRAIDNRSDLDAPGWPRMAFVEHRFANDPTNWWVPNHAAVLAMLRSTGMRVVRHPAHEIYLCVPDPDWANDPDRYSPAEMLAATGQEWQ